MKWILGALLPLVAVACATPRQETAPIYPNVLPTEAPALASLKDARLAVATDGRLYTQGITGTPGDAFVVRYGGDWPESAGERPAIGLVRIAKNFDSGKSLLAADYLQPGPELANAMVEAWDKASPPLVGKGLARVGGVSSTEVALEVGAGGGVSAGDQYLIVRAPKGGERLGLRVVAAAEVTTTTKSGATAVLTQRSGKVAEGHWAIFVGPGTGQAAQVTIQVSALPGDSDNVIRDRLVAGLKRRVKSTEARSIQVEAIDAAFDPLDPHYSGQMLPLPPTPGPRMLVSGRIDDGDVTLNYTNSGISVAHAMIAATPEVGLAAGEASSFGDKDILGLWINLSAALEAHRGHNGVAIVQLEHSLGQGGWGGPARWHARDQLAMRWAQAGFERQAVWTVQEDVALATEQGDDPAIVNAVGTLMPLYENLGLKDASLVAAERFYTVRKSLGDSVYTMHAWKAYIDSLHTAGRHEEAVTEFEAFQSACAPVVEQLQEMADKDEPAPWSPASCAGDLFFSYIGNGWREEGAARDAWFARAEEIAGILTQQQVAGLRVSQGLAALYAEDYDGSHIAFLEAQRLYRKEQNLPGVARVEALRFNLYLAQDMRQEAFESAMSAAEMYTDMGDVHELISVYRTLPWLYANIPLGERPVAPFMSRAQPTMREALKYQLASGRPERVAEVFLATGRFVMNSSPGDAEALLQRSREFALQGTNFATAARATYLLAILARGRGDGAGFRRILDEAQEFARISQDPNLMQQIKALEEGGRPERPTL